MEALRAYRLSEGLILTYDEEGEEILMEGRQKYKIIILPVWKWLLNKDKR